MGKQRSIKNQMERLLPFEAMFSATTDCPEPLNVQLSDMVKLYYTVDSNFVSEKHEA